MFRSMVLWRKKRERDWKSPTVPVKLNLQKNPLLRKLIDKLMITKEMQGNLQHVSKLIYQSQKT